MQEREKYSSGAKWEQIVGYSRGSHCPKKPNRISKNTRSTFKIKEVRNTWQFFRDRRPDLYGPIVAD
jgi:hypothetical protein